MGKMNIEAPIPLVGPGQVNKIAASYGPGEYSSLVNLEVTEEGTLRSRRCLSAVPWNPSYHDAGPFVASWDNGITGGYLDIEARIIGIIDDYVVSYFLKQYQYGTNTTSGNTVEMWAPSLLTAGEQLVGVFKYNEIIYYISTFGYGTSGAVNDFIIYWATDTFSSVPTAANMPFASFTRVEVLSNLEGRFQSFFVHKDRLFIATTNGLFWSKSTDPTVFTVPDGGFVMTPGKSLHEAHAVGNYVYILHNMGVDVFTYSSDPNVDAEYRSILVGIQARNGCLFDSDLYFTDNKSIYVASGAAVDKVHDIGLFDIGNYIARMLRMDDSIVLIWHTISDGAYVYNVKTQSAHTMLLQANNDGSEKPTFADAITPTAAFGPTNERQTFFLVNHYDEIDTGYTHSAIYRLYHDRNSYYNKLGYDEVIPSVANEAGVFTPAATQKISPFYEAEIRNISPDGLKYLKKKFRTLLMTGILPRNGMKLEFGFDGFYITRSHTLEGNIVNPTIAFGADSTLYPASDTPWYLLPDTTEVIMPHVYRAGINQRGGNLAIRLRSPLIYNIITPLGTEEPNRWEPFDEYWVGILEIIDMRYIWSYLGKPPSSLSNLNVP